MIRRKALKKKTSARKMKQALDLRLRERVFERDRRHCVKCGKTTGLQAAHILPKGRYQNMRFEPENILTLCVGCHLFWAHKDPLAFAAFVQERYPGREELLREMARIRGKVNVRELYESQRERGSF